MRLLSCFHLEVITNTCLQKSLEDSIASLKSAGNWRSTTALEKVPGIVSRIWSFGKPTDPQGAELETEKGAEVELEKEKTEPIAKPKRKSLFFLVSGASIDEKREV